MVISESDKETDCSFFLPIHRPEMPLAIFSTKISPSTSKSSLNVTMSSSVS